MWAAYDEKRNRKASVANNNGNGNHGAGARDDGSDSTESPGDLSALVSRYGGFVYWLAYYLIENAQDAEDVFERTFLAFESESTGPRQSEPVPLRLARIVLKESFDTLRHGNASKLLRLSLEAEANAPYAPPEVLDWSDEAEKHYGSEELRRMVRVGVQNLTPFSRIVFLLRDVAHLKPKEIADLLHVSVPRVESHLLRSRLQLREHLDKSFRTNPKEKVQTA